METGKDILEIFFDALASPKENLTKEFLSNGRYQIVTKENRT